MITTDEKEALLNRARDYPYWAPSQSYVWDPDDDPRDLQPFDPELTEGRWPVLAVGSNRSPSSWRANITAPAVNRWWCSMED